MRWENCILSYLTWTKCSSFLACETLHYVTLECCSDWSWTVVSSSTVKSMLPRFGSVTWSGAMKNKMLCSLRLWSKVTEWWLRDPNGTRCYWNDVQPNSWMSFTNSFWDSVELDRGSKLGCAMKWSHSWSRVHFYHNCFSRLPECSAGSLRAAAWPGKGVTNSLATCSIWQLIN